MQEQDRVDSLIFKCGANLSAHVTVSTLLYHELGDKASRIKLDLVPWQSCALSIMDRTEPSFFLQLENSTFSATRSYRYKSRLPI